MFRAHRVVLNHPPSRRSSSHPFNLLPCEHPEMGGGPRSVSTSWDISTRVRHWERTAAIQYPLHLLCKRSFSPSQGRCGPSGIFAGTYHCGRHRQASLTIHPSRLHLRHVTGMECGGTYTPIRATFRVRPTVFVSASCTVTSCCLIQPDSTLRCATAGMTQTQSI